MGKTATQTQVILIVIHVSRGQHTNTLLINRDSDINIVPGGNTAIRSYVIALVIPAVCLGAKQQHTPRQ